jgi:hypothetical protein
VTAARQVLQRHAGGHVRPRQPAATPAPTTPRAPSRSVSPRGLRPRHRDLRGPGGLHQGRRLDRPAQAGHHQEHLAHDRRPHDEAGRHHGAGRRRQVGLRGTGLHARDVRRRASFGWFLESYANFRSAHLGPQITDGSRSEQWDAHFTKGADEQYDTTTGGKVKQLATGYTKHYKASELATVKGRMGAAASGKTGSALRLRLSARRLRRLRVTLAQKLPGTRTLHVSTSTASSGSWTSSRTAALDPDGFPIAEAYYTSRTARRPSRPARPTPGPSTRRSSARTSNAVLRRVPRRQRDLRVRAAVRRLRAARGLVAVHLGEHDPVPQRHEGGLQQGPAVRRGKCSRSRPPTPRTS